MDAFNRWLLINFYINLEKIKIKTICFKKLQMSKISILTKWNKTKFQFSLEKNKRVKLKVKSNKNKTIGEI